MRSQLGKSLRKEFDLKLEKEFSQFNVDKTAIVPSGCKVYVCKIREDFWAFFVLVISPKDDSFTIEVAWTKNKEFPKYAITLPNEIPKEGNARFRLSRLISPSSDHWWYLARKKMLDDDLFISDEPLENCLKKVSPSVNEAIKQLKNYAIPYLKEIQKATMQNDFEK